MAFSINRITIVGRLGRDPEHRSFQHGGSVVNFRVATTESWKDRNSGEKQERTEWHSIAVFAKWLIDDARHLRKGDMVAIEGKQQTRKWQDQSGADRYSTECVLTGFEHSLFRIAPKKRSPGGDDQSDNQSDSQQTSGGDQGSARGAFDDDLDDDVPF